MKVLSVRQPWAWLIVHGHKGIENRSWATSHRGPVLIHASSKRVTRAEWEQARALAHSMNVVIPEELEAGGIVGMCSIVTCVEQHSSPWFKGPVGWVLADAKPLPFVPLLGKLGLFDAPAEIQTKVSSMVGSAIFNGPQLEL